MPLRCLISFVALLWSPFQHTSILLLWRFVEVDAVFCRNHPRCIDNNFPPLTLFYCICSPKLHRSFKMIYLLENSYSICCSLSHIDILPCRCFPGFAFSRTLHVSDYFSSVYQSTFFHIESHFIALLHYVSNLVSFHLYYCYPLWHLQASWFIVICEFH